MARLKYEIRAHQHARNGVPLRARLIASAAAAGAAASLAPGAANWLLEQPLVRRALERWLGIDRRRTLPHYAERTFFDWFRLHRPGPSAGRRGEVVFLADTFTNYHEPHIGEAAVRLLEAFGYRVNVPRLRCCGRPHISQGLLRQARDLAASNLAALVHFTRRGLPILGVEPSCIVALKDEYTEFGLGEAATAVAAQSWLVQDFLAERHGADTDLPYARTERQVLVHAHCHQRAVLGAGRTLKALRQVPGFTVQESGAGCCGMAGAFGYEVEHYALSRQVGELAVFPAVRAAPEGTLIVAAGTSCRHQLRDALGREAVHPVEALATALPEEAI